MIPAVGGKLATARLEAEKISDEVSRLPGSDPEEDLKDLGSELGEVAEALRTMSTSLDWERVRPSMYRIAVSGNLQEEQKGPGMVKPLLAVSPKPRNS